MPKNKVLLAGMGFLTANLIWGAANPIIKYTLGFIPPFTFVFLRLLIVCIILLPYAIIKLTEIKVSKKDYLNFFLLGLFSQSSLVIIFLAMDFTTALDATVIGIVTGALIIYSGHYFYNEKVNKTIKIGLLLTILGTFVVVIEPAFSSIGSKIPVFERIIGNVLSLIYGLTWVLYVIWSKMSAPNEKPKLVKKALSFVHLKPMTKVYPTTLVVSMTMFVGLLTTIPLAIMENLGVFSFIPFGDFNISSIDHRGILGLLYMAIFSSITAFSLNQWALEKGRVSDAAIFGYLGPVFSFPIAFLLLGEVPTGSLILGALIIATGVTVAEVGSHKIKIVRSKASGVVH